MNPILRQIKIIKVGDRLQITAKQGKSKATGKWRFEQKHGDVEGSEAGVAEIDNLANNPITADLKKQEQSNSNMK